MIHKEKEMKTCIFCATNQSIPDQKIEFQVSLLNPLITKISSCVQDFFSSYFTSMLHSVLGLKPYYQENLSCRFTFIFTLSIGSLTIYSYAHILMYYLSVYSICLVFFTFLVFIIMYVTV